MTSPLRLLLEEAELAKATNADNEIYFADATVEDWLWDNRHALADLIDAAEKVAVLEDEEGASRRFRAVLARLEGTDA